MRIPSVTRAPYQSLGALVAHRAIPRALIAGKCYEFSGEEEEAFGELAKSMDEAATGYLWLVAHAIATGAVLLWTREGRVGPWLRALADGLNDYVLAMLIYGGERRKPACAISPAG